MNLLYFYIAISPGGGSGSSVLTQSLSGIGKEALFNIIDSEVETKDIRRAAGVATIGLIIYAAFKPESIFNRQTFGKYVRKDVVNWWADIHNESIQYVGEAL